MRQETVHSPHIKPGEEKFAGSILLYNLDHTDDHGLYCLFDPESKDYHDKKTLQIQLQETIKNISRTSHGKISLRKIARVLSNDISSSIIQEIETVAEEAEHSDQLKFLVENFFSTILRKIIDNTATTPPPPELINYLLYCFAAQKPEFLLIIDSFIKIILNENGAFSREIIQRTAEVATLNYTPPVLHIYIARNPSLNDTQKNTLFQVLIAYEKIKRLVSVYQQPSPVGSPSINDFYMQIESKNAVSRTWFDKSYADAKRDNELHAAANEKKFIKRFLHQVRNKQKEEADKTAKALVLFVNDEDTIRLVNDIINNDPDCKKYKNDSRFINRAYRNLNAVMQESRIILKKSLEDEKMHKMIRKLALESRMSLLNFLKVQYKSTSQTERADNEDMKPGLNVSEYDNVSSPDMSPMILSTPSHASVVQPRDYPPLKETKLNLEKWSLMPLYRLYPVPSVSQKIFNVLCKIGDIIPEQAATDKLEFIFYIEKILELFQQVESLDMKIIIPEGFNDPLIYNTFQLSVQGLVKREEKDTYLISTGCWREHNRTRPGIFKIFGPCSMANCSGNFTVSLGLQILSSSGQLYASPMALDHTLRYPHDYDLHEPCRDRPGWIPIWLPESLRKKWDVAQRLQLETTNLREIIEETIMKANDPTQNEYVPTGNIDGFWDA